MAEIQKKNNTPEQSGFPGRRQLGQGCRIGEYSIVKKLSENVEGFVYLAQDSILGDMVQIKEFFPDANVTTDVIVGFPGETDEMFDETCEFVKKVGFGDIHVFPYSARKGTAASKFPQVNAETKKKRAEILGSIKLQLKREFLTSFLNKRLYVLTEEVHNDKICGYTHNYLKVYLDKNTVKENTEYLVLLKDFFEDGLSGEVIYE